MSNELTKTDEQKIALLSKSELSDVLKPLKQEIHLFDTFIAGTLVLKDASVLSQLKTGDRLTLKREESLYDDSRILVLNKDGVKLGNIPEKDNVVFARLLDAGKLLIGKMSGRQKAGHMEVISIGIYLVDF